MRVITDEEAIATIKLQQMVLDFWQEIDANYGRNATDFFTEDCVGRTGAFAFDDHAGVRAYYRQRMLDLGGGVEPAAAHPGRHICHNLRVVLDGRCAATVTFLVFSLATSGPPPFAGGSVPLVISEVRLECRLDARGAWRIGGFYGSPLFIGDQPLRLYQP